MRSSFAAKADALALAMTIKEATLAESVFAFAFTFLLGFGWFPSAWGSACPGSQHPFPCAVETCTAPSEVQSNFNQRPVNAACSGHPFRVRLFRSATLIALGPPFGAPRMWRIALLVELAGFAPASSTHILQYLQGISPCYYHTTAGRRKPLVFLIWYVDCGFSRLLSGLRRNQSTYQMARSYRAIGSMLTWGSV